MVEGSARPAVPRHACQIRRQGTKGMIPMWKRPNLSAEDEMMGRQVTWAATLPALGVFGMGFLVLIATMAVAIFGHSPYWALAVFVPGFMTLAWVSARWHMLTVQFIPDDENVMSTANVVEVDRR